MQVFDRAPSSEKEQSRRISEKKWKRTRSGCLNCRRKRRKCDENKPTCRSCQKRHEVCRWGMRITFRDENSQTLPVPEKARQLPRNFKILNVTSEVIRDYHEFQPSEEIFNEDNTNCQPIHEQIGEGEPEIGSRRSTEHRGNLDNQPSHEIRLSLEANRQLPNNYQQNLMCSNISHPQGEITWNPTELNTTVDGTEASLKNSWLQQVLQRDSLSIRDDVTEFNATCSPASGSFQGGCYDQAVVLADLHSRDGIFLPGSEYLELHSTLRNHLMLEARSVAPTRRCTPDELGRDFSPPADYTPIPAILSDHMQLNLPKEEEYILWKSWLQEIAPWLDKFDNQCHFQNTLPTMARSHDHLRYAMLAVSARQLERKGATVQIERSLELYHHAIHLLLPQLPTRSTAVIASCVVLCVLEMLSCAPKAWRRHLDGCAGLMEAVRINGFVGGLEQALFWCFARMDVCGGLISSTKTLIPINHWASGIDLDTDIGLFRSHSAFDTYANYAVYLLAQVLDVLTPHYTSSRGASTRNRSPNDRDFIERWLKLWRYLEDWYLKRPEEMKPVMYGTSFDNTFPTILFTNPAAISGNQLYHTASLLMLQTRPPDIHLNPKPRSALWHARHVCGISMSNDHHGAWTNAIQPLWIAGQWMSHSSEHHAILDLLERIENESGWPTQSRAEDLKEFWGDE